MYNVVVIGSIPVAIFQAIKSACHLIEFYAGVYETLSDIIGIDFIKRKPQPIKILPNGKHRLLKIFYFEEIKKLRSGYQAFAARLQQLINDMVHSIC